jgi:hypothetical protein
LVVATFLRNVKSRAACPENTAHRAVATAAAATTEKRPSASRASSTKTANLPDPDIIAAGITEDLQAAVAQFAEIANDLKR